MILLVWSHVNYNCVALDWSLVKHEFIGPIVFCKIYTYLYCFCSILCNTNSLHTW